MGPYGSKNFKQHILWKYTSDLLPKTHSYSQLPGKVSTKAVQKNCEISNFGFLAKFFYFINMGPYGSESFNNISPERTPDLLPKIHVYS